MSTVNFQMFKLDLEKAEEPEIKLSIFAGSQKKQESSRRTSTFALLTTPKLLCGSQQTVENSERDGNIRPPELPLENPYAGLETTVRTRHRKTDFSKYEKEYVKGHPAYLTYMQSTS